MPLDAGSAFDDLTVGPLDCEILVTQFPDQWAKTKREVRTTPRKLADAIGRRTGTSKSALPFLKLATFGAAASDKGCLRTSANMMTLYGCEGDYDAGEIGPDEAARRMRQAGLAGIVYTTPSHTSEAPRWRVLAVLSHPVAPFERDALCARLNGALGGILADESFNRSQTFYYGGVGAPVRVDLVDGRYLDEADDIRPVPKGGREQAPITALSPVPFNRQRMQSALDAIPVSARDDREAGWRPVGMGLHHASGGSEDGFELWDAWSQPSTNYDAADQRRVWESFGRYEGAQLTAKTVERIAAGHGWVAPFETSRLRLLSPADCAATAPRGYVWKNLIAPGDLVCIFGDPGVGKSAIAPRVAYAIAQGVPAFGYRTRAGGVFYVPGEDAAGMRMRVRVLHDRHGPATGFHVVEGVTDLRAPDSPDLAALLELISEHQPAVAVLDTQAACFPGGDEGAESHARVVQVCRQITALGPAAILLHHGTKADGTTPRGHSVLNGALDMAMHLVRDDAGVVTGRMTKNRNGPCDKPIRFAIEGVRLGTDEDGDPITAAYAVEVSGPVQIKLSDAATAALAILRDMIAASGAHSVAEGKWREACIESGRLSSSPIRNTQWHATKRAEDALIHAKRIAVCDGDVSIIGHGEADDTFDL